MDKKSIRKVLALTLVGLLALGCTGCNKAEKTQVASNELKVWMQLNSILSTKVENFGKTPLAKEIDKQTGMKTTYEHPAQGQATEAFNLMIASGDLPDIIQANWYEQGPEKMIDNGTILDLTPYIEGGKMPNLKKILDANPEWDRMIKTDDGRYYVAPFFRGDKSLLNYSGMIIRKDWLDDLGLDIPTTIADWEEMLVAFKEKKGATVPLAVMADTLSNGALSQAFGIYGLEYMDNGEFKYAPMEKGYEDYLKLIKKWYDMGLIDANIASVDAKTTDAYIMNGESGATFGLVGGGIGKYMNAMKDKDPKFELVAAPYPVLKEGDVPQFSVTDLDHSPGSSCAISAKSKNIDAAVKFLDYAYGEKGNLLYNFGIEGVSYEMVDGQPKFTQHLQDIISGKNTDESIHFYSMGVYSGPLVQMKTLVEQTLVLPQQVEAYKTWFVPTATEHRVPYVQYTDAEKEKRVSIFRDISTLQGEKMISYVTGRESIDTLGEYRKQLESMGIKDAIKITNDAYKRYTKR